MPRDAKYWLMKSEPSEFSIDDLVASPEQKVGWFGVRNYQARNFMVREMKIGDPCFFYHSSCKEPGIYGVVEVCSKPYPDPTQFDPGSGYFDEAATRDKPRWFQVDVRFRRKTRFVSIADLRANAKLSTMRVLQKGNRLSITPVTANEWKIISTML